ncbi:MAG: NAD(P)/FAD-dependent oxidoreductase [Phormidesmis sp.]
MASKYDYELVVIGAGSGGLSAARRAAKLGKRVAIAEKNHVGGTCVNRGCIPTRLMVYAAEFAKQQQLAGDYGWVNQKRRSDRVFDWASFRQTMDGHVRSLRKRQAESLENIDILRGQAEFIDAHTLKIDERKVTAQFVLIAVGSRPKMPDIEGINYAMDSRDVLNLESLPESLLVVGGGYIGIEIAQVMRCYGCEVTVVESNPYVLDGFDCDVQKRVKQLLIDDGIKVVDDARLKKIERVDSALAATLGNGKTVEADKILCALGRTANIDTLNLAAVDVITHKGKIVVDEQKRTQEESIFAVGDCTDTIMLTPVAIAEGKAAVEAMFEGKAAKLDYRWVPSAVFLHPEVAMVGPTEEEAKDQGEDFEIVSTTFTPLRYAISAEPLEAMIKLIVRSSDQQILGVHMVAPRAADLVQALVPALKKGLSVDELREIIPIHPSTGEEIFSL